VESDCKINYRTIPSLFFIKVELVEVPVLQLEPTPFLNGDDFRGEFDDGILYVTRHGLS